MLWYLLLMSLILSCQASDPKSRVKDTLSDKEHGDSEHHNPDYDHEAFLGKEEAKTYNGLTPEKSKEKLAKLFDQVDAQTTADGFVTEDELHQWIQTVQKRYMIENTEKQMKQNDEDNDGSVTWDEYKRNNGFHPEEESEKKQHAEMMVRDEERFKLADKGGDNKLDKVEFSAFLHPENHDHMKGILINETVQEIDKDKDGFISLEEFIGDLWPEEDRSGAEPDWVTTEKEQFSEHHDTNKDGKLDREEVKSWILPPDFGDTFTEAKHLVSESDANGDGKISKEEMVEKYDLFVGSQATDYGEIFNSHDEL